VHVFAVEEFEVQRLVDGGAVAGRELVQACGHDGLGIEQGGVAGLVTGGVQGG
jgi:hypothetical protein